MQRSCASCNNPTRAPAQLDHEQGSTQPSTNHKQLGGNVTRSINSERPAIQSSLSIAKQALQAREAVLEDISRISQESFGAIRCLLESPKVQPPNYDIESITVRRQLLSSAQKHDETEELLSSFRSLVTRNIGGISNPHVEAPVVHDRKHTFNRYKRTVRQATIRINELFDASKARDDRVHIYDFVCDTISEFGKSATLLSGGGTLGMYHIGVLKTFRETNPRLISQVISGASAGSIVAAVFASKKDRDLDDAVQRLCHGDLDVFVGEDEQEQGIFARLQAAWKRRALYDPKNLERVMKELLGEKLTFKDAFNLTGKRLNITVSTSDGDKDDFRLLNYITSPEVVIWSAVVASCAVPFAFPAGQLYFRDTDMTLKRVDTPVGHMDGSIYGDVPMDRMSREFNINYFIVSQVNPHVVPFLDTDKTLPRWPLYLYFAAGKGLVSSAIVSTLDPLKEWTILGAPVFRAVGSIFHQRYEGDLTLFPVRLGRNLRDVLSCMNNPTHDFMDRAVENGEKEAEKMLPKAHAVLDVEMMLHDLKVQLKTKLKFSKSEEDLHRKELKDRMQSSRSYTTLSRRGGAQHGSTKSVALPSTTNLVSARAHRTSQSLELGYMQLNISAEKVAGSVHDTDSTLSTLGSDDEDDSGDEGEADRGGLRIAMPTRNLHRFTSNPPSPLDTRRRIYFPPSRSSSRSSSPGDPLASMGSLRMTPRAPSTRSASPEQSRNGANSIRKETESTESMGPPQEGKKSRRVRGFPSSLRSLIDVQSVPSPMDFRMGRNFFRKRSLSAAGVDDWVRAKGRGQGDREKGRG